MSKTESAFNSFLTKEFKRYRPNFYAVKISDKYKSGLSDFVIFCNGKSLALECKNILTTEGTGMLLKHPFSPEQRNFFRNVSGTGNLAFGLLGVDDENRMYLIPPSAITENGNVTRERLRGCHPFERSIKGVAEFVKFFGGADA